MIERIERPDPGPAPRRCFRGNDEPGGAPGSGVETTLDGGGGPGRALVCRFCRGPITNRRDAIEVEGRHQHTFFNPAGILFEIGCFGAAPGCLVSGQPTDEFAWFAGYRWRYSSCRFCGAHLGWCFSAGAGLSFHGLIVARLLEEDRDGSDP